MVRAEQQQEGLRREAGGDPRQDAGHGRPPSLHRQLQAPPPAPPRGLLQAGPGGSGRGVGEGGGEGDQDGQVEPSPGLRRGLRVSPQQPRAGPSQPQGLRQQDQGRAGGAQTEPGKPAGAAGNGVFPATFQTEEIGRGGHHHPPSSTLFHQEGPGWEESFRAKPKL